MCETGSVDLEWLQTTSGGLYNKAAAVVQTPRTMSCLLPSTYIEATFQQSLENINSYTLGSYQNFVNRTAAPTWQAQQALDALAFWDMQHNTTMFEDYFNVHQSAWALHGIDDGCVTWYKVAEVDCYNDDSGWAAIAALSGYEAYGNSTYLEWAIGAWEFITYNGFINQTTLAAGYLQGDHFPNNTLQSTCDGYSMYGGVYWQSGSSNPNSFNQTGTWNPNGTFKAANDNFIAFASCAEYAMTSARLCQLTGSLSYCQYALSTLDFMNQFMADDGLVPGGIDGNCTITQNNSINLDNTGNYLGAYAIVGNMTNNVTASDIASNGFLAVLNSNRVNSGHGIMQEGAATFTGPFGLAGLQSIIIRRFNQLFGLFTNSVQQAMLQYANIQYWALTQCDSDSPSQPNIYGPYWTGPYDVSTNFTAFNLLIAQAEAMDVLAAVVMLNPSSAFPTNISDSSPVATARTGRCATAAPGVKVSG